MSYPQRNELPRPKRFEGAYQGRLQQFTARFGEYGSLNLAAFVDRERVDSSENVSLKVFSVPDLARPSFSEAIKEAKGHWRPAHKGDFFGPSWSTHWFRVELKVPERWMEAEEAPLFDFDSSDEGFYYSADGTPLQGLSGEHGRTEISLSKEWLDGEWHTFFIETSCNNITGVGTPADPNRQFMLGRADLVLPHGSVRALKADFDALSSVARELPADSWQRRRALDVANRIINAFDRRNVDPSVKTCRALARTFLGNVDSADVYAVQGEEADADTPYPDTAEVGKNLVYCIGNCHIDTAWLWPFAETRRKVARSWASQLDLLERYPEYVFVASQAVQFKWLKEDHPDLFERLRTAVKGGRFVPIGGSWVECDTNMPSGESLVRQMCLGQRFFEREFGLRSRVFWLPDTFGYAPQVPQVCRLAGQPYFLTQKLSWNDVDKFPLSTFNWVGLDRSQVLCHMPPLNTYTADATVGDVLRTTTQNRSQESDPRALLLFGYGDGGGGPTSAMLESLRRCRGISNEARALPTVASGPQFSPNAFFEAIQAATANGNELVTWSGEMYLEYHRGTYTTQAAIKRGNRHSEALMYVVEFYATLASLVASYSYPFATIESLWEKVCLNQFHDVLPGSGITMIYEDARRIYKEVWEEGNKLLDESLEALGQERCKAKDASWLRVMCELKEGAFDEWMFADECYSIPSAFTDTPSAPSPDVTDDIMVLENERFQLELDNGKLVELRDKFANRQVLNGTGNQLVLYEDQPQNFPAWDTEQYAAEKVVRLEPVRWHQHNEQCAEIEYVFGNSRIVQRILVRSHFIEFVTQVDWHETYQFLKVEFPVDVFNDYATYETAFGMHHRPTHYNTSWDASRFEVCGHRYADLSDWSYGVSLLNDCKYGYSVQGNVMRLSLLRAPKNPDPQADMGAHKFRYALAPHRGGLSPHTVWLAEAFNSSPVWTRAMKNAEDLGDRGIFTLQGDESVRESSVKRAFADADEPGQKRVVLRLYESLGARATKKVVIDRVLTLAAAYETNTLEDKESYKKLDIEVSPHEMTPKIFFVTLEFKPFEVKTILLDFSDQKDVIELSDTELV